VSLSKDKRRANSSDTNRDVCFNSRTRERRWS
jgi:hypothetical protein